MAVKADITIDIDKQVGELQNLTQIYNARVGDNKTPLTIAWRKNDLPLNLKGLHAYIVGKTGDGSYNSETGKIDFPVNTPVSQFEDDGSGTLDGGQSGLTTLLIPKQMWQNSGLFAGYIGLKSEDGSVFTSKDIWFKVLGNVLDTGVEINYFIGDFDKALAEAEKKLQDKTDNFDQATAQALQNLHDKYMQKAQHAEDTLSNTNAAIDANLASLKKIASEISIMELQIEADEIVTKPELAGQLNDMRNDFKNIVSQNAKGTPQVIVSLDELKKTYPTGSAGVYLSTADNHLYSYINGTWSDLGLYQEKGLGKREVNYDNVSYETITGYHNPQNLIDLKEIKRGYYYYVDANNKGQELPNSDYCYVRVPVTENQRLFISGSTNSGVFVDEKENTVSSFVGAQYFDDGTVKNKTYMEYSGIVPKNAKFLYQSFSLENIPYAYIGYDSNVVPPNSIDTRLINDSSVKTNKLSQVYVPFKSNFVDNSKIIKGQYVAFATGDLIANPDFSVTDYVEIDPRLKWEVSADTGFLNSQLAFYDENKHYISGLESEYNLQKTDIPANTQYARFTMHKGQEDSFTVKPLAKIDISYLDLDKLKDNLKDKELVVSKDSNGDFTTIKDALLYTWTHPNATIRVAAGVYDIYQELGADFFKNYDKTFSDKFSEEPFSRGLPLCNNAHLIFDSRAKVIFNYPGDNEHVLSYFSLFSCSPKGTGVIVDGLNAVASNCHYIIHDDLGSYNPGHVANEFKNLNLSLDNIKNTAEHKSTCIGGGLTFDEHVEIKDSYFYGANGFVTVSYHNHAMDNSRSQLVLKDCYFEDGNSFQAINFGSHNPNSLFLVSNNSFGDNPQWDSKFQSTDPTNVIVKHWNNEIRNTANISTRTADNDTSNVINLS